MCSSLEKQETVRVEQQCHPALQVMTQPSVFGGVWGGLCLLLVVIGRHWFRTGRSFVHENQRGHCSHSDSDGLVYGRDGECYDCGPPAITVGLVGALLAAFTALLILVIEPLLRRVERSCKAEANRLQLNAAYRDRTSKKTERTVVRLALPDSITACKTAIDHYQVLAIFVNMKLFWPSSTLSIMRAMAATCGLRADMVLQWGTNVVASTCYERLALVMRVCMPTVPIWIALAYFQTRSTMETRQQFARVQGKAEKKQRRAGEVRHSNALSRRLSSDTDEEQLEETNFLQGTGTGSCSIVATLLFISVISNSMRAFVCLPNERITHGSQAMAEQKLQRAYQKKNMEMYVPHLVDDAALASAVECTSDDSQWLASAVVGIILAVLLCLILPLWLLFKVRSYRKEASNNLKGGRSTLTRSKSLAFHTALGFVFLRYRPKMWYWEGFVWLRKFAYVAAHFMLSGEDSSDAEYIICLGITVVSFLMQFLAKPMATPAANRHETICQLMNLVFLGIGALFLPQYDDSAWGDKRVSPWLPGGNATQHHMEESVGTEATGYMLLVLQVAVLVRSGPPMSALPPIMRAARSL
eukprot:SAG25_NODE_644_length_6218_cov_5.273901_1_plen_584_part_00